MDAIAVSHRAAAEQQQSRESECELSHGCRSNGDLRRSLRRFRKLKLDRRSAEDPLAKFALEADALGDLEARDDAPLDLLARTSRIIGKLTGMSLRCGLRETQLTRLTTATTHAGKHLHGPCAELQRNFQLGPSHPDRFHGSSSGLASFRQMRCWQSTTRLRM